MARISIPDEIIELAKQHPEKKREIYWDAIAYIIDHEELKRQWLLKYLDKRTRISEKMKGNQNRCGTSEKTDVAELKTDVAELKNSSGRTETRKVRTVKTKENEEALGIYISNNNIVYNIIHEYITSNINTWNISYLINKQWEEKYIASQMKEAEKIIKQVWLETFTTILNYIKQDDFWSKQILSIAKLNRKNKEWVPYYIVMMDNIKNYTPKVIHIPTV